MTDWAEAACAGQDSEKWFPDARDTQDEAYARFVCQRCPIRSACLQRAVEAENSDAAGGRYGIFGGVGPSERRKLARRGGTPEPHGTTQAYSRHRYRGERPCGDCLRAWSEHNRQRYARLRDSRAAPAGAPTSSTTDVLPGTEAESDPVYPPAEEPPAQAAPLPSLTVKEKGWTLVSDGEYASWGAIIHNPGEDVAGVTIRASALDSSGDALETTTESVFRIPGGADIPVGGVFLDAKGVKKVTVEVDDDFSAYEEDHPPVVGKITSTTKVTGSGYEARIVVRATSTLAAPTVDGMPVCVVFRGARKKILGGTCGFTPGSIRPGRTVSLALQDAVTTLVPDGVRTASTFFDVSNSYLKAG